MAITFVGSDVGGGNIATLPAGDLVWPTVQADDVALLFWTMSTTVTPTTPTDFTLVTNNDGGAGSLRIYIYRKVCTGSEGGTNVGCTVTAATRQSAAIVVYRGVDTTTPVDGTPSFDGTHATGTTHDNPAYTPSVSGCAIVTSIHERATNVDTAWTPPTDYTERADTLTEATGSGGTITAVADDGLLVSNPSGTPVTPGVWTGNHGTGTPNIGTYTLALRAASAGTEHTVTPTDSAGLTDSLTTELIKDVTATDSAGLTDTLAKSIETVPTDSAGLTDTLAAERTTVTTDGAGLTDTAAVEVSKLVTQTDSAGLTDTTAHTVAPTATDSVGLTDGIVVSRATVATDSAGLTDTSLVESGKAQGATDSAGLTDTTTLQRGLVPTDSAGLTDDAAIARSKAPTDSAGLTDTAVVGILLGVTQTDNAGLTDTTALARTAEHTDLTGLTDTLAMELAALLTDSAGLTDSLTSVVGSPYEPAYLSVDGSTTSGGTDNTTLVLTTGVGGTTTAGSVMG